MSRISDLMLKVGEAQAQQHLNRGRVLGEAVQTLGQLPLTLGQLRTQQAEAARAQQLDESRLATDALTRRNVEGQITSREADETRERQGRELAAKTERVNAWLTSLASLDPETQQAEYLRGRAQLVADGTLTEQDAPAMFPGQSWIKSRLALTLPAVERFKQLFPEAPKPERVELNTPDGGKTIQFVTPKEGQQFTSAAPPKAPTPPVELNPGTVLVDPVTGKQIARGLPPREPQTPQPSYMWAKDPADPTGPARLMTPDEIRRLGAGQPDTADMRNRDAGKRTAARAVEAVKELGGKIITKVGPEQRAKAIKDGVEAVFGSNPEFQTYQDSRMALAGTLAVEQQGSRVSDADVKALWLPMVPDAYRDTAESYKLKWDLIDAMRGVERQTQDVEYDSNGNPIKKP